MENNNSYGIVTGPDNWLIYTDVSRTLKGAKRYATIHSFDKVGIRYNSGYVCKVVSIKVNNKWKDQ
jgi:hypothetical protein